MGCCCCKKQNRGGRFNRPRFGSKALEEKRQEIMAYNSTHTVHQVLDRADFEEQLKSAGSKLVVVDFFATWCGPCKMIGPEMEKMADGMADVIFLKVDVDHLEELAAEHNITVMPTFIAFLEGKRVGDFSGANVEKLKAFVNEKNKLERQPVTAKVTEEPAALVPVKD